MSRVPWRLADSTLEILEERIALSAEMSFISASSLSHSNDVDDAVLLQTDAQLPLSFEVNQGQTDPAVDFLSRGSGYSLFLTRGTAVLRLTDTSAMSATDVSETSPTITTVLRMSLDGANPDPQVEGQELQAGVSNYLIGNDPSQWHTSVPNYGRVAYHDVYPGIDMIYYGKQRQLEYDFTVDPGADPGAIRLRFEGADSMSLDSDGNLILHTSTGEVVEQAPILYQDVNGERKAVAGNYVLDGPDRVRFHVGEYDPTKTLVIDPVLSYSSYLGGTGTDVGQAIAVDGDGSAYVTGYSSSTNFPTTTGARQTTNAGITDVFVTKLNAAGTGLVYSTYLGGSSDDFSAGIALDSSGNAFITGYTKSTNFPVTGSAYQRTLGGVEDAFITKLNSTGTAIVYSTYLGGSSVDHGNGIAVDGSGYAYITGYTSSIAVTAGAYQATGAGSTEAFVTKLNAAGTGLVYSTYLGGSSDDRAYAITVDSSGSAYVAGFTFSTNFPVSVNAKQKTNGGQADGFVTKLNSAGSALNYSTYLGGSSDDQLYGIALDSSGNAYVAGYTNSTNFPVTANAFQATKGVSYDAVVTKLNSTGTSLIYSTHLGGNSGDYGDAIAVDSSGNAYVTGGTQSTNFPVTGGARQTTFGGLRDAYVTKLNSVGTQQIYSTYFGGSLYDHGNGIAMDSSGNAYVAGETRSTNFPTSTGAKQTSFGGGTSDAFVLKFAKNTPTLSVTAGGTVVVGSGSKLTASVALAAGYNATGTLTFTLRNPSGTVVNTETATVNGNNTYSTPLGYLPTIGGVYTWQVSYNGDSENFSVTSSNVPQTANAAPSVTTSPTNQTINSGQNTSFSAAASGYPAPAVQWRVSTDGGATYSPLANNSVYSGVTTTTLTVANAEGTLHNNRYQAVFTNTIGSANTDAASLKVVTVSHVNDTSVSVGQNATFTEVSTGALDTVQWQVSTDGGISFQALVNGDKYSGVTTPTLTVLGATSSLNDNCYRAVISNAAGSLTTNGAKLTVLDIITAQPSDRSVNAGQNVTFVAVSGYASDAVQWYVSNNGGGTFTPLSNGSVYAGVTTTTLTITGAAASLNGNQYRAVFTPLASTPYTASLVTNPAFLTVDSIKQQPGNQRYGAGQTVSFTAASVLASDAVQWTISTDGGSTYEPLTNSGPYSGVTTTTLTITGASAAMASEEYRAVFTNANGSFVSLPAALVPVKLWDSDTASNWVPEGAATNQTVGITAAADLNDGASLTYRLTDDAGGRFTIDPASGVVRVALGNLINSQAAGGYKITAEAQDPSGGTVTETFTLSVASMPPSVPVDSNPMPNSVVEQAATGTPVGVTASAVSFNPITYTLTNDADGRFAIDAATGVVTVAKGNLLSYASAASHMITVRASDSQGVASAQSFTIRVTSSAANAISIGGFALVNSMVNGSNVSGDSNLPLAGSVHLSGTVLNGQYTLSTTTLGGVAVNGFTLDSANFTLTNSGLDLAGSGTFPVFGHVNLAGPIQFDDDFRLALSAPLPTLSGFTLTAATIIPSNSGVGIEVQANLPTLGNIKLAGVIASDGSYTLSANLPTLSINGHWLSNAVATLSEGGLRLSGDASLPVVGTVHLSGDYESGQYMLTANLPDFMLSGVRLTGGIVSLNSSGVSLEGMASLPVVGMVALSGVLPNASQYSLSASVPSVTLGGISLANTTVTLKNSGVSFTGIATLPLIGNVALSGPVRDASDYTLSATVPHLSAGGFSLNNVVVTLDDGEIAVNGTSTLPIAGTLPLSGTVLGDAHFSFRGHVPNVDVGGFALTDADVILTSDGLRLVADATLPVLGKVRHIQGSLQDATHFSLSVPVPTVAIGLFSLGNNLVTLSNVGNGVTLGVTGDVNLPLFGVVTVAGDIDPDGNFSFSELVPDFSLPGGALQVKNTTVTLYSDRVHVDTDVSILGLAEAHFTGDVFANGEYELVASADLTIAGFTIPKPPSSEPNLTFKNGELEIGFDYGLPGLDAFLPPGQGDVSFSGTYAANGQWSLTATADYTIAIGPVIVTSEQITLTPDSLTLLAHGSVADLGPLAEGDVSMTIFRNGTFHATVDVTSSVAGFSLGVANVTFGNHNDSQTFIATLHGVTTLPAGPNVALDGYWDANGKYDFRGTQSVALGPLTFANAQFGMSNLHGPAAFTFAAGVNFGVYQADVTGQFVTDGHGGFTAYSHAKGTVLGVLNLDLDGFVDSSGNFEFNGTQDVKLGPLNLSQTEFELSSANGLTFSDDWNFLGVFTGTVSAQVGSDSQGIVLTTEAVGTVLGSSLHLRGDIHAANFDLSGSAPINVGPFSLASADFELSNVTGFTFGSSWNYLGLFTGDVSATINSDSEGYLLTASAAGTVFGQTTSLNGVIRPTSYDLRGDARVALGPLSLANAHFQLSSATGFTFSSGWNYLNAFSGSVKGTIGTDAQGYVIDTEAVGRIFGQTLELEGTIHPNSYFLEGEARLGLGIFVTLAKIDFELSSANGFTFSGGWDYLNVFSGNLTGTIGNGIVAATATGTIFGASIELQGSISNGGRTYELLGNADVNVGPLSLAQADFKLSSASGFTFVAAWDYRVFSGSVTGKIGKEGNSYFVYVDAEGSILDQTLKSHLQGNIRSNGKYDLRATADLSLAGVSLTNVGLQLSNVDGVEDFTFIATWNYALFDGGVRGTIGTGGRVQFEGVASVELAGFNFRVHADADLNPGASSTVNLSSTLDVYVAVVDFSAGATWNGNSMPDLTLTGSADIGGVLAKLFEGNAQFTVGTSVIGFGGTFGVPQVPGVSVSFSATVDGNGHLTGIPGIDWLPSFEDLINLAIHAWHELGVAYDNIARGLNVSLGVPDQQLVELFRSAGVSPGDIRTALKSAFNWDDNKLSNFLSAGGGALSNGIQNVGSVVTGKKKVKLGVPAGSLVYFDGNIDNVLSAGEPWGFTTSQGEVTFEIPSSFDTNNNHLLDDSEGQWIVIGGTDITTGIAPVGRLVTPASWEIATPLTTLTSAIAHDFALPLGDARSQVLLAMGLPGQLDLSTFDPLAETLAGNVLGAQVEAVHARVEDTVAGVAGLFRTPSNESPSLTLTDMIQSVLVDRIVQSTSPIDFADGSTIAGIIHDVELRTGITLASDLITTAATVIAGINERIDSLPVTATLAYLSEVSKLRMIAQGTLADDLASAANGLMSIADVIAKHTGAGLSTQIDTARTPPWVVVPLQMTAAATGPNGASVDFDVHAYDLAGQPLTLTVDFPSGSVFPLGTTTVTAAATDALGNSSSSSFTITVLPITPPTLTVPPDLILEATTASGADVILPEATATDPLDPDPQVIADHNSGFFPIGTTTVWVTATDIYGNSSTDSFTVTVRDTTPPELLEPQDMVFEADQEGGANITLPSAIAIDLADPSPHVTADHTSGFFPLGLTRVTVTATDAAGNLTERTFTVNVVDTRAPVLMLPEDLEIEANHLGGAVLTLPVATATDLVDLSPHIAYDRSSGFFPLGTTPVVVTVTDASGNVSAGTFSVTVRDTTAPTLALPSNLVIEADQIGGATVTLPPLTATDYADSSPLLTVDQASGFLPLGLTLVSVQASDASGNMSYGIFTVTVVDTQAPILALPTNVVVPANIPGGAIVTLPSATATDLVDQAPQLSYDRYSGTFPLGTTTVRVTARDASGNSTDGSFTVTVLSTTPPTLSVPPNLIVESTVPGGGALVTLPVAIATSVADPNPAIAYDHPSGFFPLGTTTVRVTATDVAGNSSTDTFAVTVVDTTPPSLTLPANLFVPANAPGGASISLPTVTATDTVDAHPEITLDYPSTFFPVGTTTVRVTAKDAADNVSRGTFTVTVAGISTMTSFAAINGNSSSTYGDVLRFTITVNPAFGAAIPDGETVTLLDANNGNAVVGRGTLLAGSATVRVPRLNAGSHEIVASFSGTGEYAASQSGALTHVVEQRPLRIQAVTNTKSYDGTTSASAVPVVTGLQSGDSIVGLSQSYSTPSIGSGKTLVPYGEVSDGNGGQNYSVTFVNNVTGRIGKGAPVLNWADPANITVGTALGPDQLNATADVAGTFTYSPPLGTVLLVGNSQTLSVTFTPDDTSDYDPTTATVLVNVLPPNEPPTLNPIDSLSVEAETRGFSILLTGITAGPASEVGQTLTTTAVSDRPDLVPNPIVTMAADGTAVLQLNPATAVGVATITVTVKDDGGTENGGVDVVQRTFSVTLLDTTPPRTSVTATGVLGNDNWYLTPVTVFLHSTDVVSGVARTYYQVDGGEWMIYMGAFSVSTDGAHTVNYYSEDGASNAEPLQQLSLQIDTNAPITSLTAEGIQGDNGWYTSAVHLHLIGSEYASDVAARYIRIDGGDFQPYIDPVPVTGDGRHTISYYSVDAAGNVEDVQSSIVEIDGTMPTISAYATTADGNNYEPGTWTNQVVTVQFSTSDATSGIAVGPPDVILSTEGDGQNASGTAIDQAGNSASAAVADIRIDTTAPVTMVDGHGYQGDWVDHPVVLTLHVADQAGLSGVQRSYYAIDEGDAQVYDGTVDIVLTDPGIYQVNYGSVDYAGNVESHTLTVLIQNNPPTVAANRAAVSADEGSAAANSGVFYDPQGNDTVTLTASVGSVTKDDANGTWSWSIDTMDGMAGPFAVTITATDSAGDTVSTVFEYSVNNVAPTVLLQSVSPVDENGVATLNGTISDPGALDVFTVELTWGDPLSPSNTQTFSLGTSALTKIHDGMDWDPDARTFSVDHQYLDDQPTNTDSDQYTIQVTLTDDDGGLDTDSTTTTISNVAPTIDTLSATSVDENGTVHLTGTYHDVGTLDTHMLTINWGEGAPQTLMVTGGTFDFTYQYLDDQPTNTASDQYTIQVTLTDDDGGFDADSTTTTISNVAPTIDTLSATSVDENGTVHLTGTYHDVGTLDTHLLTINWGESAPQTLLVSGGTFDFTYQYLDDQPTNTPSDQYTIQVTLTDDDGGFDTDSATTTISNVAPTIDNLSATSVDENGTVHLTGSYHDVGTLDTHLLTINWGEGVSQTLMVTGGTFAFTHQYLDDQPTNTASDQYAIQVTLTDDDGGFDADSTTTTISNVAPTIDNLSATSVDENGTVHLTGTYHDVGTLDTHMLTINWGEGAPQTLLVTGGTFAFTHQYLDDQPTNTASDQYTIQVTLTDDDGGLDTDSTTTTISNVAPTIDTLSATSVDENGTVHLTGTYHDVGTLDTHMLTINWGEGAPQTLMVTGGTFVFTHQYLDDQPTNTDSDQYTIQVTLTDDDGGLDTDSTTTTISNVAPTIDTLSATSVDENGTVHLTGTYHDVGTLDTHMLTINWGEGTPQTLLVSGGTFAFTYQYLDDQPTNTPSDQYTIQVTLTDDDGGLDTDSATTTISNVAPTIDNLSATSVDENGTVHLTGSYHDVGTLDTHLLTINWGEGVSQTLMVTGGTFAFTHQYLDDQPTNTASDQYAIQVTLTDDDGGFDADSTTTTISNVAPTIDNLSATSVDENGTVHLTGTYHDVGTLDTHMLTINWGEGAPQTLLVTGGTFAFTHQYLDDQPTNTASDQYTIQVTLTDDDGGLDTDSTTTTISNVAPTIDNLSATSVDENGTVHLTGSYHDVGTLDTHLLTINWGEGVSQTLMVTGGTFAFTHQYLDDQPTNTASDQYAIQVTLTDDDGGFDADSTTTTISNVAPTIDNLSATSVDENGTVHLTGSYHDVGTLDTHMLTINWADGNISPVALDPVTRTFSASHQYLDDAGTGDPSNIYAIRVTLTDDDGGVDTASIAVTVNNLAPEITSLSLPGWNNKGLERTSIEVMGTFGDIGTLDTHHIRISWGDGSESLIAETDASIDQDANTFAIEHTYANGGIYTVTVTLSDDDGDSDTLSGVAVISGAGVDANGILWIIGSDDDDIGLIQASGSQLLVIASFLPQRYPFIPGDIKSFPLSSVSSISAYFGAGNDVFGVTDSVTLPVVLRGEAGNDALTGGGGRTILRGGLGNDKLFAGRGASVLLGEEGADELRGSGLSDNDDYSRMILIGGSGVDRLFAGRKGDVLVGGSTNLDDDNLALDAALAQWNNQATSVTYDQRVAALLLAMSDIDDNAADSLTGGAGRDLYFDGLGDVLIDVKRTGSNKETVIR